jgi:hypothetical protein
METPLNPGRLLDEAQTLEQVAEIYLEAAKKIREAAGLLHAAGLKDADLNRVRNLIMHGMVATHPDDDHVSRIDQLNTILRSTGRPLDRAAFIRAAVRRQIPRNTAAAYITGTNFSYRDGYWWIKGDDWPEYVTVAGTRIPFESLSKDKITLSGIEKEIIQTFLDLQAKKGEKEASDSDRQTGL